MLPFVLLVSVITIVFFSIFIWSANLKIVSSMQSIMLLLINTKGLYMLSVQ